MARRQQAALLDAVETNGRRTRWALLAGSLLISGVLLMALAPGGALLAPVALLAGALFAGWRALR